MDDKRLIKEKLDKLEDAVENLPKFDQGFLNRKQRRQLASKARKAKKRV